jgi:hypothetical protein
MKYIKLFEDFIFEAFDLNQMYTKHKMPNTIRTISEKFVNEKLSRNDNVPSDIEKNKEKIIFWIARELKKEVLIKIQKEIDPFFEKGKDNLSEREQEELSQFLSEQAYLNGKDFKKYGISENDIIKNVVDRIQYEFDNRIEKALNPIFDWFLSPVRNQHEKIDYVSSSIQDLYRKQDEWHKSLTASGKITNETGIILKKYPDGYYWIDLTTNSCEMEAKAMGHCATTNASTMLSLRKVHESGGIEPFVTVAVDVDEDIISEYDGTGKLPTAEEMVYYNIHQIKGKQNTKPVPKYHPYIVDLLCMPQFEDTELEMDEYSPENDFHIFDLVDEDLIEKIMDERPDLFDTSNIYKYENMLPNIIKHFPEVVETNDFLNSYVLYKNGYVEAEKLQSVAPKDFRLVKDSVINKGGDEDLIQPCFVVSDPIEFSNLVKWKSNREYNYEDMFESIVNYDNDYEPQYSDWSTVKSLYDYDFVSKESKQSIIEKIEEIDSDFYSESDEYEIEELESVGLTEENWKEEILNNDRDCKKLLTLLDIDAMDSVKDAFVGAYNEAKDTADRDEAYKACMNAVNDFFGNDVKYQEGYGGFVAKLNMDYVSFSYDIELASDRSDCTDYVRNAITEEDEYENSPYEEIEEVEINIPYYGWEGEVTKELFDDTLPHRLDWM